MHQIDFDLVLECSKDSDVRTESPEPHEKMMKRFACKLNSMEQAILYYKIEEHVQQYKVLPHTEDQNTKLVVAYWLFDHNRIYVSKIECLERFAASEKGYLGRFGYLRPNILITPTVHTPNTRTCAQKTWCEKIRRYYHIPSLVCSDGSA